MYVTSRRSLKYYVHFLFVLFLSNLPSSILKLLSNGCTITVYVVFGFKLRLCLGGGGNYVISLYVYV